MEPVAEPVASHRRPARGRLQSDRDDALCHAALDLLAEVGYDRLTVDAVAARAGTSKATLYRRWPSKADMVLEAVTSHVVPPPSAVDTGSLRGDLAALLAGDDGDAADTARVMRGMVAAVARDDDLAVAFQESFVRRHTEAIADLLRRAVDRGEVPPGRDLQLLASVAPALFLYQLVTTRAVPAAAWKDRIIDEVLVPLYTSPPNPEEGPDASR